MSYLRHVCENTFVSVEGPDAIRLYAYLFEPDTVATRPACRILFHL